MKTITFFLIIFVLSLSWGMAQNHTPLLGEKAPSFTAESTTGTINFPADFSGHWKIIFSHPADFTPVCSSEMLDLMEFQDEFQTLKTDLLVVSTDNLDNHRQWVASLESLSYKSRKSEKIMFPLIADPDHSIAKKYGMIHPENNSTKDVRGVFIIDPKNEIRAIFYYPMNIGRNIDEIKRSVQALQIADKQEVLTPAGWKPGEDVLVPYTKYTADQELKASTEDPGLYKISWYMWFRKVQ